MNILIDTGIYDIPERLENTIESAAGEFNLSEPKIYPSDVDTDMVVVAVGPRQMAIVTAYWEDAGDLDAQGVEVFKVLTTSGVPASGGAGCYPCVSEVASRVLRRVKMCGWEMEYCRSVLVLTTPGKYQFVPNNAAAGVILTAQILPLQEFNDGLDNSIRP